MFSLLLKDLIFDFYFLSNPSKNENLFNGIIEFPDAAGAFRGLPSIYVFSYFPFGFEGRIWDLIVSVPDHCLSFYFAFYRPEQEHYE